MKVMSFRKADSTPRLRSEQAKLTADGFGKSRHFPDIVWKIAGDGYNVDFAGLVMVKIGIKIIKGLKLNSRNMVYY
jgi:hypothetical protein